MILWDPLLSLILILITSTFPLHWSQLSFTLKGIIILLQPPNSSNFLFICISYLACLYKFFVDVIASKEFFFQLKLTSEFLKIRVYLAAIKEMMGLAITWTNQLARQNNNGVISLSCPVRKTKLQGSRQRGYREIQELGVKMSLEVLVPQFFGG